MSYGCLKVYSKEGKSFICGKALSDGIVRYCKECGKEMREISADLRRKYWNE